MKNYLHKILHPISMVVGHLHNFLIVKIPQGKYESMKILDVARKNEKNDFLGFLNFSALLL
jgi:hypothetical protein